MILSAGRRIKSSVIVVAGSVLMLSLARPTAQSPSIPIDIESARALSGETIPPAPPTLVVTVRNRGNRTVAAWGVAIEVRRVDGSTGRLALRFDSVEDTAVNHPLNPRLLPDARHTASQPAPLGRDLSPVVDVAATPTFAVFDDDTAVGDEKSIAATFDDRLVRRQIWQLAEQALTRETQRGAGPDAALRGADAELEAVTDERLRQSLTLTIARQMMSWSLRDRRPDRSLVVQELQQQIGLRRTANTAHAQRRP